MTVCNPMTSQERMRLAQRLHQRAKDPKLTLKERQTAFRHACNLVRINMVVAEQRPALARPSLVSDRTA